MQSPSILQTLLVYQDDVCSDYGLVWHSVLVRYRLSYECGVGKQVLSSHPKEGMNPCLHGLSIMFTSEFRWSIAKNCHVSFSDFYLLHSRQKFE